MEITCAITGKPFTISPRKQKYLAERNLPLPRVASWETLKWIESFRNRIYLYNATCAFSSKAILSCIPPENGIPVYDTNIWNSEQWDATNYGIDYDFSKPFFVQLAALMKKVPLPAVTVVESTIENSPYVNGAVNLKNCYLTFICLDSQDCMFAWNVFNSSQVVDSVYCYFSELCFGCIDIDHCYNLLFCESCIRCSDSAFLFNCQACKNCFGCVNLSNKEYCWYNEQLSKEEFEKRRKSVNLGSKNTVAEEEKRFKDLRKKFPIKYYRGKNIENSSGNYLLNSKNCHHCYLTSDSQDCEDCIISLQAKDSFCVSSNRGAELLYNCQSGSNYDNQFCNECLFTKNLQYCLYCTNGTSDCFGCISLRKKQYCILNKQYSKEEYFSLIAKIKGQMLANDEYQDFFPKEMSPFYYNHSEAMSFFPLTKEQALAQGFKWQDDTIEPFTTTYHIPDDIKDVKDDILEQTLKCQKTGKKYRIVKQELEFCRKMGVPIATIAPIERITERSQFFAVHPLQTRACSHCLQPVETVYTDPELEVLCESCYQQKVF
ncbi:MAG: hypothetical protein HY817_00055 [Candidatus Abawacabacteria bacterium]|nr:hypothetical protein [Candidatus Abawacabacteria bacterium]